MKGLMTSVGFRDEEHRRRFNQTLAANDLGVNDTFQALADELIENPALQEAVKNRVSGVAVTVPSKGSKRKGAKH